MAIKKYMLSVVEPKNNELVIGFRDIETGEQTDYSIIDWDHNFVIWPRIKNNADKKYDRKTITSYSHDIIDRLKKKIEHKYSNENKVVNKVYPALQTYLPIKEKSNLENIVSNLEFTKGEKKIFEDLEVPSGFAEYIRNTFAEPGDIVEIDERYFDVLKYKKEIHKGFEDLEQEIRKDLNKDYKKSGQSRHINELNKIFNKYSGDNFNKVKEDLSENSYTKKLNDFYSKRRELEDKIFDLDKRLKKINASNKASFYNKNKNNKGSSDYTLETIISDDKLIRSKKKMSGKELRKQTWVSIDIEKPLFDTPDEEISWVTLVYYTNGKITRKETHTLRNPGIKERNGRSIHSYSNYDEMLEGINNSIEEVNPYGFTAYNAKFDFMEIRGASDKNFGIGARNEEPKFKSTISFFERIGLRGKLIFDQLRWAQMFFPHLPNKKLNLVAKEVLGPERFDKIINYDEMAVLERIAINSDYYYNNEVDDKLIQLLKKEADKDSNGFKDNLSIYAARVIEDYVSSDTEILPELFHSDIGRESFDVLCDFCQKNDISIEEVVTYNNVTKLYKRGFFEETGIPYDVMYPVHTKNFLKSERNALNRSKTRKKKLLNAKNKPGFYKDVHKLYVPFSQDFLSLFEFADNTKNVINNLPEIYKSGIEKYFYSNIIEAILRPITIDYEELIKNYKIMMKDDKIKIMMDKGFKDVYKNVISKIKDGRSSHIPSGKEISESRLISDKDDLKSLKKGIRNDLLFAYTIYKERKDDTEVWKYLKENDLTLTNLIDSIKIEFRDKMPKSLVKYNKRANRFYAKLLKDPIDYENLLEKNFATIREFLKENDNKIVYNSGNYIYVTGGKINELKKLDSPVIYADHIGPALVDSTSNAKQKIFYHKHHYWHGIKIKESHPDNNYSFFEMDLLGGFLKDMIDGNENNAFNNFKKKLRSLDSGINNLDLCNYVKSRNVFQLYIPREKKKVEFKSVEKLEKAKPDLVRYKREILNQSKNLLTPVISPDQFAEIFKKSSLQGSKKAKPKKEQINLF